MRFVVQGLKLIIPVYVYIVPQAGRDLAWSPIHKWSVQFLFVTHPRSLEYLP